MTEGLEALKALERNITLGFIDNVERTLKRNGLLKAKCLPCSI